ncbi:MAG: hypothetical protein JNK60_07405 [Acidobacteria bacterium]|nr:hypothetical protein [Acidobacteriota bacterium]
MKARAGLFFLSALLLHLALYLPSLPNQLVYDDTYFVTQNPVVSGRAPLASAFTRPYYDAEKRNTLAYRPLGSLSMGLSVRLYGPSPALLRLENMLWAAAGAALFGVLLFRLSGQSSVAWLGLSLLSCHPIRSEAVLTIVGRSELVSFCCLVLAVILALDALERESTALALGSAASYLAAILAKENGIVTPALLAACVLLAPPCAGIRERLFRRPAGLLSLAAFWGLALVLAFVPRRLVLGGLISGPDAIVDPLFNMLRALPTGARPGAGLALLATFFERLLWPATLCGDYAAWSFSREWLTSPAPAFLGAGLLLAFLALGAFSRRRLPLVSLGIAWLLAAYLPFSNILFVHGTAFAERLLTVPVAGFLIAVAAAVGAAVGAAASGREGGGRRIVALVAISACLLGAARIWRRIPDFRTEETFFAAVVRDYPGNARAHWVLGVAALSRRDREGAVQGIGTALAGYPDFTGLALDYAIDGMRRGDRETARTIVLAFRRSGIVPEAPAAGILSALEKDLGGDPQRP